MQHSIASTTNGLRMLSFVLNALAFTVSTSPEPLCLIVIKGRETERERETYSAVDVTDRSGRRSTSRKCFPLLPREKLFFELSRSRAYSSRVVFHRRGHGQSLRVPSDSSKASLYGMSSSSHSLSHSIPSFLRAAFFPSRSSGTHFELPTNDDRDRFNHPGRSGELSEVQIGQRDSIRSSLIWSEIKMISSQSDG